MTKTTQKTAKPRGGTITAAAAVESLLGSKSLCESCIWDCVQPLGRTVVCPYWEKRAPDAERQSRRGQQRFVFDEVAAAKSSVAAKNSGTAKSSGTR